MAPASAAWLTALAVALPLSAQPSPAESVDSSTALGDADRIVWTAAALETLLATRDYPSLLLISAMSRGPDRDSGVEDLDRLVGALSPRVERSGLDAGGEDRRRGDVALEACRAASTVAAGTLCSMERLVALAPPALAGDITEEGARLVALSLPPAGRAGVAEAGASAGLAALSFDPLQTFGESALDRVWRQAHAPVGAADAHLLDGALTRLVGVSPLASAGQVLDVAPGLRSLLASHPLPGPLASFGSATGSVGDGYPSFLRGLTAPALGPSFGTALGGTPGSESIAPTETDASDTEWATGRSFVYLAAQSAQLAGAGSGAAERMRVLGGVAVDLRREAAALPSTLASVGRDLAVATLSGNVLALASRVTSFFRGTPGALGPDAARDVRALREGMESMRSELRLGMGTLDRGLDDLLVGVDTRFAKLEGLVDATGRDVRADLAALHDDVLALGERLDRMDASIRSYVNAGFDREHARTLVRCLEHRDRYLPPWNEMTFAVFSECLADLRTRAVADARDALLVDRSTPIDDLSLISALADRSLPSLSHRFPLLARVAAERFAYSALGPDARLANAVEWAVASEAYVTLLQDWPSHALAVRAGDLEAMRAIGLDLQRALRALSTDVSTGDAAPLLDRVAAYYRERLDELGREAEALARRHRQLGLRRVAPETLLAEMESDDVSSPPVDVPPVIEAAVPAALKTGAVLGLEDVELVYALESEESVSRANFRRRFLFFGRRHDRITHTRVTVHVALRMGSLGTIARFRAAGPFVLTRTDEMNGDERSNSVVSSREHVSNPHTHFLTFDWPALAGDPDAWEVEPIQPHVLDDLEVRIDAELRRYATVGLDNVFAAVCSDDPARVILSGADRTSALRVRNALNGLSAARALLEAYLRLAIPAAADDGMLLTTALSRSSALLDRGSLCTGVALGESPLRTVWLEEEQERRLDEFTSQLPDVLRHAAQRAEIGTLVDVTLSRLDAALRVQRLRAAVATAY